MKNLLNAKKALSDARRAYMEACEEARQDMVYLLQRNGDMTTADMCAATGVDAQTVRSLLCPRSRWDDYRIVELDGGRTAYVRKERVNVTRQFALMREDGSVDTSQTIHQTCRMNKYSLR